MFLNATPDSQPHERLWFPLPAIPNPCRLFPAAHIGEATISQEMFLNYLAGRQGCFPTLTTHDSVTENSGLLENNKQKNTVLKVSWNWDLGRCVPYSPYAQKNKATKRTHQKQQT